MYGSAGYDERKMQLNNPVIINKARSLFDTKMHAGKVGQFLARLFHRSDQLLQLDEVVRSDAIEGSAYAGTQTVDIEQIRGTESRADDFDKEFNPIKGSIRERWQAIARAFLIGEELPPVDLIQVGDIYFVRDGHHRVSVARSMGQRYIEAEITMMRIGKFPL
jgi:hypothetical protein